MRISGVYLVELFLYTPLALKKQQNGAKRWEINNLTLIAYTSNYPRKISNEVIQKSLQREAGRAVSAINLKNFETTAHSTDFLCIKPFSNSN